LELRKDRNDGQHLYDQEPKLPSIEGSPLEGPPTWLQITPDNLSWNPWTEIMINQNTPVIGTV
jgi:hypothetical protein